MTKEEIFYESSSAQAKEQDVRRQHFDTMAVAIIGFAAVLVGLTTFTSGHWTRLSLVLFVLMLLTFVAVSFFSWSTARLRGWKKQPNLEDLELHIKSGEYDDGTLVAWTGRQVASGVKENEERLAGKADSLQKAYCALFAHVGLTGMFIASVAAPIFSSGACSS